VIILPFGLIFLIVGFIIYRMDLKAAREREFREIQSRLAEIERRKQAEAAGEVFEPVAKTRRIRSRR
jgi:hypothetical protein